MTVQLTAPNTPCSIVVPEGALDGMVGEPTAASNTLTLIWDEDAPEPVIGTASKFSSTDARRVPLLIDFGERVTAMNPLDLFKTEGFGRRGSCRRGTCAVDGRCSAPRMHASEGSHPAAGRCPAVAPPEGTA